jgi:serine protease Do
MLPTSAAASVPVGIGAGLPDLVEKILPGVVNIASSTTVRQQIYGMDDFLRFWGIPQEYTRSSAGSGFLLDREGYVLTNSHVVENATEVFVTLHDKREFRAKLIGKDPKLDLAILQIRDSSRKVPTDLVPLNFGDSDSVRIAEPVLAVGNPMGLQHTVTMGIISAKNRTIGAGPYDNFLQTDASINPGNSGGPLFNLKGEVIGVNTAIISRSGTSGGLGFAIPSNEAKRAIPDLKRYGRIPRPWLGVLGQPVTPALARVYGFTVKNGVLVYNLVRRGPADRADVQRGDIIIGVGDKTVEDPNALERTLGAHRPKDLIQLKLLRGSRTLRVEIRLEEHPPLEDLPEGII